MLIHEKLTVQTDANNIPFVHMPSHQLWDFVEFMASHRPAVVYSFRERKEAFYVLFGRQSSEQAQEMVDEFSSELL